MFEVRIERSKKKRKERRHKNRNKLMFRKITLLYIRSNFIGSPLIEKMLMKLVVSNDKTENTIRGPNFPKWFEIRVIILFPLKPSTVVGK